MKTQIWLLALIIAASTSVATAEGCGEHGTVIDGKCSCTTPRPEASSIGYVGDDCTTPVYYHAASAEDTDVATSCQGEPCMTLEPQHEVCFLVDLQNLFLTPAHLGLVLHSQDNATIDVQGLLTEQDSLVYPNSSSRYNFVVSATAQKPVASLYLDRGTIGVGRPSCLYLCATNAGTTTTTFALRVASHSCPFQLSVDGTTSLCSSPGPAEVRHDSSTCPLGMCSCTGAWARPQAPVYEGLGFEDCSAASMQLPGGPQVQHHMEAQAPGTWSFFNFTVAAAAQQDRHIMAAVTATANTSSDVELYLKYWQAPGRHVTQYDLRSDPGDFRRRVLRADLSSSINLDYTSPAYRPGVWFLGVFVNGDQPASYDVQLARTSCLNDCGGSSRGTCDAATGTCTCTKESYVGPDCSSTQDGVAIGTSYSSEPRAGFAYDRLEVPVGDILTAAPGKSLSLVVDASFSSTQPLPAWVTERPILLLSDAPISDLYNATLRAVLQDAGANISVVVEASQVPSKTLHLAIYNPVNYPYQIGYSLAVRTAAHCINSCTGHGSCGSDGRCACQAGYTGPDCSVDIAQLQQQDCMEGSLREALDIPGGKAYAVCVCSAPNQCAFTAVADEAAIIQAHIACSQGYEVVGAAADAIKLSDGRAVPGGGHCAHIRRGTSGGMVFFYCVLTIALFCGMVIGGKYGLERYQVWRASQVGGYADLGAGEGPTLWDAFTGARRNPQNNDSW